MANTTSTIGRSKLTFPDLSYDGGTDLEDLVKDMLIALSDDLNSRYQEYSAIADSSTVELDHNFGVAIEELTVWIYTGSGTNLVRVNNLISAGWAFNAKVGSEKLILEIDTPSSGGPHTFSVVVRKGPKNWNTYSASASQNVNAWDEILADTSGGIFTLTLPASPSIGDRVRVVDFSDDFGTNTLTIGRNGNNIQGLAADLTLSTNGDSAELVFNGTDDWRMV